MPRLLIDNSVAPDFRALIQESWWKFLAYFEARSGCFGDIQIVAVKDQTDRARYDPATATTYVRVPERGSLLRAALIHEWAHHLEFQCPAQVAMRQDFLAAQGFSAETEWHAADGSLNMQPWLWAKIPSEQFAETVVAIVLDKRSLRTTAPITDAGIRVVEAWARNK